MLDIMEKQHWNIPQNSLAQLQQILVTLTLVMLALQSLMWFNLNTEPCINDSKPFFLVF